MTRQERKRNGDKTVLVVDDEADVREIVSEIIADMGYQVKDVPDAKSAQDLMSSIPVHLVISDVQMKGMDGIALARWIHDHFPKTPMALITALPSDDLRGVLRQKLVNSLLRKPFLMGELQGMVQNLTR
jgi:two-component system response regulator PilR (NtrC family)